MSSAPSPDRAAALAALAAILDQLSEPAVVIVQTRGVQLASLRIDPPPTPPPQPRDDDDRDCRSDVLAVLRAAGRRLTTSQILTELERRNWLWGEGTVKRHLAALVAEGTLTSDTGARPPGYCPAP